MRGMTREASGSLPLAADALRRAFQGQEWPAWIAYAASLVIPAGLTAALLLINRFLPLAHFPVFYFLTTTAVAYWFGLGPALLAFAASFVLFSGLFAEMRVEWWPIASTEEGWASLVALLLGSGAGVAGALMVRRSRRKAHRLALRVMESDERIRNIFESITDAFFAVDTEWRLTYVNAEAGLALGREPDDLIGRSFWEEFPEVSGTPIRANLMAAMEGHVRASFEEYYPPFAKWFEIHAYPSAEGLSVYFRDVTERKAAADALHEVENQRVDFYRRTLLAATGGKLLTMDRSDIETLAGYPEECWAITTAADLGRIRREVSDSCEAAGLDEERLSRFSICLGEALTNALKHAGGGRATLHRVAGRVIVLVSDEGPGIGELNLPEVALAPGYSTAGTLGMGYKVMISFADRVYLYTGPDGTVVGLEMELVPAGDHPGLPSNNCGAVW